MGEVWELNLKMYFSKSWGTFKQYYHYFVNNIEPEANKFASYLHHIYTVYIVSKMNPKIDQKKIYKEDFKKQQSNPKVWKHLS